MTSTKYAKTVKEAQEFIETLKAFQTQSPASSEIQGPVGNENGSETTNLPEILSGTPNLPEISFIPENEIWPTKKKNLRHEIITFIEQVFRNTGKLPTEADFRLNFPDLVLNEDFFFSLQEPLTNRGIPAYSVSDDYYEPNFVMAVGLICNVYDKRSVPAKLKEAGLTGAQWRAFLRKPHLQSYYRSCIDKIFDEDTKIEARLQVAKAVSQGDLQAIKHFNELQNIYRPGDQTQTVMLLLQGVMEILARYVTPDVLNKVASEIKTIEVKEIGPVN